MRIFLLLILITVLWGCDHGQDPVAHSHNGDQVVDHEHTTPTPEEDVQGRVAWQKPELIINKLGDLTGKTIADIGAGTGYFTFRLVRKADKVIAIDIDQDMIDVMEVFRENLDSIQNTRLDIRLALPDNPKLENEEVDVVLIINTIAYIEDRKTYLANLMSSLKDDGKIMIVDYKMKRIPGDIAPSVEDRLTMLEIEDVLDEVGYTNIKTDDRSLDYQYIITATKSEL